MVSPVKATCNIDTILFDMNGTLRMRVPDKAFQDQSVKLLLELLETPDAPASLPDELTRRYKSYTQWANENGVSLSEAEIWTQWITPEMPPERIEPRAAELLLALRNCKGRTTLKPEAAHVVTELHEGGYRLGVISNTTSSLDLPRFIHENNLDDFFETVILSSTFGYRKPAPEIFWEAARVLNVKSEQCAYLGNNYANDVVGSRNAGFGMALLIELNSINEHGQYSNEKPDAILNSLNDLLDLFPPRSQSKVI
jgi:putative hydrolase of the HAD superfamily